MLYGKEDGMDSDNLELISISLVFHGDLGLCVGSQPWDDLLVLAFSESLAELIGVEMGDWVEFLGFGGRISDHESLVSGSDVFVFYVVLDDGIVDLLALLVDGHDDSGDSVVHSDVDIGITHFLNGFTGHLFDVNLCLRVNFSEYHTDVILNGAFAGDLGVLVLS